MTSAQRSGHEAPRHHPIHGEIPYWRSRQVEMYAPHPKNAAWPERDLTRVTAQDVPGDAELRGHEHDDGGVPRGRAWRTTRAGPPAPGEPLPPPARTRARANRGSRAPHEPLGANRTTRRYSDQDEDELAAVGTAGATAAAQQTARTLGRRFDLHTHYHPRPTSDRIRDSGGEFGFDQSPTGQTIIKYRGARFFGITPPMTDVSKRLADMDRVGIDVEVVSLSTPNVFFTDGPAPARRREDGERRLCGARREDTRSASRPSRRSRWTLPTRRWRSCIARSTT